ncbi:MAG: dTDP-glucose 4,6-dehydratase [Chloroflexota bacterium]|jgi:dTDP-glucose 4,6-dehydratase|nr:dTDP-glucose 4,6-dehydratase [Chloroflexota bacterium]
MKLLVAGGAGFIGSNYVRYVCATTDDEVVVLDKLTYAGNLENLQELLTTPRVRFVQGDIANADAVATAMAGVDAVVNFAAETHVDRSILDPGSFISTDVYGVYVLLEAARVANVQRFLHVSTDEVYGVVHEGSAPEEARLLPRSPYSASKAGGELLVYAYHVTYGVPTLVTRGSNTFGPYQYPEKLIPVVITEAIDQRPIPVYGDGRQVRDWLYVEDHCAGIDLVLRHGEPGEAYNVGGGNERYNVDVVARILDALGRPHTLIEHVPDRPGHDVRYSVETRKLDRLGWDRSRPFEDALEATVRWYVDHEPWWRRIKEGAEYRAYFTRNYGSRGESAAPGPSR